jgi:glutamate carboxypeptidase
MKTLTEGLLATLVLTCCSGPATALAALSAQEQQIADYAAGHTDDAIGVLQRIVDIDSPTENVDGVRQVGAVMKGEFEALGMTTRWIDMPAEMKRAGHLVAETRGTQGKRVLMIGHIDTVLSGERFRREGDKAFGSGASDMKSGVVVLLYALKALHSVGALDDARIVVMLTGDEEDAGMPYDVSRGDLVTLARASDLALSFEATIRNTATVGRRGASSWNIEVDGATGHSGGIFDKDSGAGAIFQAARIIDDFYRSLRGERYLTFNPSVIVGGTQASLDDATGTATGKSNVIPAKVLIMGDLRYISARQESAVRAKMSRIVARNLPKTSAHIEFHEGYPAMTPTKGNYALLAKLNAVSKELGAGTVEALDPADRGAGDIGFIAPLLPSLDGIGGASGDNAHAPGEWTNLEPLPRLIQRSAVLLYRLTR